jgi:hypothetical protein
MPSQVTAFGPGMCFFEGLQQRLILLLMQGMQRRV